MDFPGRVEDGEVFPDDLAGIIALDSLGTGIPGADVAPAIKQKNGVVSHALDEETEQLLITAREWTFLFSYRVFHRRSSIKHWLHKQHRKSIRQGCARCHCRPNRCVGWTRYATSMDGAVFPTPRGCSNALRRIQRLNPMTCNPFTDRLCATRTIGSEHASHQGQGVVRHLPPVVRLNLSVIVPLVPLAACPGYHPTAS
jgi:hypothetical protein